jgi:DNA-binding transcriptional MocR family regulator
VAYRRNSNTAWRKIAEETIVVHLDAKEFFGLNDSAAEIWNALDGTTDPKSLADQLKFNHDGVVAFCKELEEQGLVEGIEGDAAPSADAFESNEPPSADRIFEGVDPPRILWREKIQQVAASCAFLAGQNPLCNQVPIS